ncbi:S-layer homology domain-containing protein [Ureibacillus sp. FSL W7-1570]|uniref:S-layer homology domain-containing protein n=1 Tax=Ureibacillus sp. FSL W7-1570 TaxID=2954593 RepID=UPI003159F732
MANQPKNYKKFVATAATATLVASAIVPVASAASFSDIEGNTHADAIKALSDAGIIKGYEDGTFKPNAEINRGQTVKLLGRWLETKGYKVPENWNTVQRFNDLPVNAADSELVKYAALVKDAGVFNGSNGNLNYNQPMQRQQMALVLVRAIKTVEGIDLIKEYKDAGYTSKIKDLDKAYSTENVEAITALEYAGITVVENFNPTSAITRGQFASFLNRTINYEAPVKELKVVSAEAINAKQLVIKFSKPVKKDDVVAPETTGTETKDTLVNGKISLTSLDGNAVAINDAKAELSEDGKTLKLTATGNEVFKGRYDIKIDLGAIKSKDNEEIEKFEATIKAEDNTAPTIVGTEKVTSTKFKVKFSEPIKSLGTYTFKVGDKDIATGGNGVMVSFTPGNDYAEFTLGSDVEAGQTVVAKFVGVLDYADKVISPNPVSVSFTKGAKDGVAPTVTSITVVSGKTLEVKFSEELAAVPTIKVGGNTATVEQDKNDKTKYIATLATAVSGLQTVVIEAPFTDLSGEVQNDSYSRAVNFSIDTTAPKLVSSTVETGSDNAQYLVLTFDENVEKGSVTSITVTGKKTKNYITSNLTQVNIGDTSKLQFSSENKKVVKIAIADLLGANDEEGAVFEITVTGNNPLVQDESGNTGLKEVKSSFTRVKDGSAPTKAPATIDKTYDGNGVKVEGNNTLTVKFEQAVDGATATNPANYVIENAVVEKAELGSDEKTVTLTLKSGSVQDTGARQITIKNVKAKNGTAMEVYNTVESLNENVLPTLQSAQITAVDAGTNSTTIVFTFSENVKTDGAAVTFDVKSGTTTVGTATIANDTTADTKTLTVTINAAVTIDQISTGLTLTKTSGDIVDAVGNKFDVGTGILIKQ